MPIKSCTTDGKPGYKWGESGKCYTYTPGDKASMKAAKAKAIKQAVAASYKGGKQVTKVDLSIQMQEITEKNVPLAVCSVCLYEAQGFVDGADPITLPCPVCNGKMEDPKGFLYVPSNFEALKLHYRPWTEGKKVPGIE